MRYEASTIFTADAADAVKAPTKEFKGTVRLDDGLWRGGNLPSLIELLCIEVVHATPEGGGG